MSDKPVRTQKKEERFECHGHLMMDGEDYLQAKKRHANGPDLERIKEELGRLKEAGVVYFRDGGDALGVSAAARELAPRYGIRYATPLFAIHKKGHYGGIVGYSYSTVEEYKNLVRKVRSENGGFIKIMISGIITFQKDGELSCAPLPEEEIRTLTQIAHDAGYPVMAHANGDETVRAAIRSGIDSIEHGAFMREETVDLLAQSKTVWVPTAAAIAAFTGRSGFDEQISREILTRHLNNIRRAAQKGALIAAGSDSGAAGVPHGFGTVWEYELLERAGVSKAELNRANNKIREIFKEGI